MNKSTWCCIALALIVAGCPLPEMGGEGQECFDPPDQCNGGLLCDPDTNTCVKPECTVDSDCETNQYCEKSDYSCLPGCRSDQSCGSGYFCNLDTRECERDIDCLVDADCAPSEYCNMDDNTCHIGCRSDQSCEPGFICNVVSRQCERDPDLPAKLGEPCNFTGSSGVVHADANECESGLVCLGVDPDGSYGTCPGGAIENCWRVNELWNPDCVNGNCACSLCCAYCVEDQCPAGYYSVVIGSGDCVCLSERPGDGCHPMLQDCPAGEKCGPLRGLETWCIPVGNVTEGNTCSYDDNLLCQQGYWCSSSAGLATCKKLCDKEDTSTCPVGYYCQGLIDIDRWGVCKPETKRSLVLEFVQSTGGHEQVDPVEVVPVQ